MTKRGLKIFVGGIMFLGVLFSCEKETLEPYVFEPGDEPLSYSADIQPIFNSSCVSCHAGSIAPDLRAENSYTALIDDELINTENPAQSELVTKLQSGSHAARASEVDKQKILLWIEQGAENN